MKKEVDSFLCLGDIVGYGAQPNECCALVRELKAICVAGNHDWGAVGKMSLDYFNPYAAEAIIWTAEKLKNENWEFISALPETYEEKIFTIVHGSLSEPIEEYLLSSSQARDTFSLLKTHILFFGHTHIPTLFLQRKGEMMVATIPLRGDVVINIKDDYRYLINPGSVGQPRDGIPLASAAVYDNERKEVRIFRIEYPIEEAQRSIISAGLPLVLAERLSFGW